MTNDIYVSYSRSDNHDDAVNNFASILKDKTRYYTSKNLDIHLNYHPVNINDPNWKIEVSEDIESSVLFLALITPSYFNDPICLFEWEQFAEKQKEQTETIMFTVDLVDLIDDDFNIESYIDENGKRVFKQYEKLSETNIRWIDIKNDEQLISTVFKKYTRKLSGALKNIQPNDRKKLNCHIINREIDEVAKHNRFSEIKQKLGSTERAYPELKPVCVIYTGGTVGMVRVNELNRNSELKIGDIDEVVTYLPKLRELELDINFFSYEKPLDSSNITSDDWQYLAEIITELYKFYQGFVILHGANTLAYTASALSFMFQNLSKPIVITGAEIPLVELNSDAEHNGP